MIGSKRAKLVERIRRREEDVAKAELALRRRELSNAEHSLLESLKVIENAGWESKPLRASDVVLFGSSISGQRAIIARQRVAVRAALELEQEALAAWQDAHMHHEGSSRLVEKAVGRETAEELAQEQTAMDDAGLIRWGRDHS